MKILVKLFLYLWCKCCSLFRLSKSKGTFSQIYFLTTKNPLPLLMGERDSIHMNQKYIHIVTGQDIPLSNPLFYCCLKCTQKILRNKNCKDIAFLPLLSLRVKINIL